MQRIFSEGLDLALEKGLKPFYLLSGQDILLVLESKDKIIATTRQYEFDEKIEIAVNNETKWDDLADQLQSTGLFSSKQIFILNFPDNPTTTHQKQLMSLLELAHSDVLFILHFPKLTKAMEKQSWFSIVENDGIQIQCQTPDITKLPTWLKYRAKSMQIQLDQETIDLLCYSYEGNLLALKQTLQLLQLQYPNQLITSIKAKDVIAQSAQYTPFQWIDALLEGKIARATHILNHLKNEEVQPVVLLRIIQKELMILLEITRSPMVINSNEPLFNRNLRTEFDRLKVWQNRRTTYQSAVQRLTYRKLYQQIQALAELEKQIKQEFSEEIWANLEHLGLLFT
ncbi:DNA polymerase III subunit delta [Otariodibacter oris]|uniref:DNA polymerase III subunit delta n=1 Tax=Otariodibacter oris TaxID=1032623 RepID=UPI000EAC2216|nr:DNA polymerase III subunit delta [Otariodibacter oris]QGM81704.1 DNA polymerase III subunit delta [Otariodibacter oris]